MTAISRVKAGDPFRVRARDWNAIASAVEAVENIRTNRPRWTRDTDAGMVLVRNDTGSSVVAGEALAVRSPLFSPPEETTPTGGFVDRDFRGLVPTWPVDAGRFVIAKEKIPDGELGRAVASGIIAARIQVPEDDAAYVGVDIQDQSVVLQATFSGPGSILYREPGSGLRWAIIDLRRPAPERFPAIIGKCYPVAERCFGWRYDWTEAWLDGDLMAETYGTWVARTGGRASNAETRAWNRLESPLRTLGVNTSDGANLFLPFGAQSGPDAKIPIQGYACGCDDQGTPPTVTAPPFISEHADISDVLGFAPMPIPGGTLVELQGERDSLGNPVFAFSAMVASRFIATQATAGGGGGGE